VIEAPPGSFVYGPRGIPHTFVVSSETARFLLVAEPGGFAEFVRSFAQPADAVVIPPPVTDPPDIAAMSRAPPSTAWRSLAPRGSRPERLAGSGACRPQAEAERSERADEILVRSVRASRGARSADTTVRTPHRLTMTPSLGSRAQGLSAVPSSVRGGCAESRLQDREYR
jgi:hypothetical protein